MVVLCKTDQGSYMVWIKLTVSSQTVQKSLDVWSEDCMERCIVYLVEMLSETVPKVKGNLHHLDHEDQNRDWSSNQSFRFKQTRKAFRDTN